MDLGPECEFRHLEVLGGPLPQKPQEVLVSFSRFPSQLSRPRDVYK